MKTFVLYASGLICVLACSVDVTVHHKGIPSTIDHEVEVTAPGLLAPEPAKAEDEPNDAGDAPEG